MCHVENTDGEFEEVSIRGNADIWQKVDHGWLSLTSLAEPNTLVIKKGWYDGGVSLIIILFLVMLVVFLIFFICTL